MRIKQKTAPELRAELREKKKYDPLLIARLQPAGNLKYDDERYIKTGDGFCSCIQVYEYPGIVYDFWLTSLMSIEGVYTTVDVATQEEEEAVNNISRSLDELNNRYDEATSEGTRVEDKNNYELLHDMLSSVKTQGETIKLLLCRIYVCGRTTQEVDERVHEVIKNLEGMEYRLAVFLNETEFQYKALFSPYHTQVKQRNRRTGSPLPSISLAGGYPFNFEELDDPFGLYIGYSETGGNVIVDTFHKTKMRLSYDALLVGKKGSGKSTALKMLLENAAISGNYIRLLDKTGEFTELVQAFGGTVITMDGTQGIINYLEVFRTSENESNNFGAHLSKLNTFYKFANPSADVDERNEFEEYVRRLYEQKGLWPAADGRKITGLPPEDYPTFPELLQLLRQDLYFDMDARKVNKNLSPSRWKRLESIELTLSNLVNSYPLLFSGTTSIPDLTSQKIVVYNVQGISNMKPEIFNALLFNILNLMLDDMIRIGAPSKAMHEHGTPVQEIPKLLLMIDEAHEFINTRNPLALDFMIKIVREGRKYFTGLLFASQSIRDFAPESTGEGVEKLKTLFELCQYKFIMQQDSNALDLMRKIFERELTESQFQSIPRFGQGECLLLTGEDILHTCLAPTPAELELFKGGA